MVDVPLSKVNRKFRELRSNSGMRIHTHLSVPDVSEDYPIYSSSIIVFRRLSLF